MLSPDKIKEIIEYESDALWSVADISYSNFRDNFVRAIIIAQSYGGYFLTNEEYCEENYHQILVEAKIVTNEKINCLKQLLDQYGIINYVPPLAQTDEIELIAPFSFKYAAVQAGLGWIGKNGVLITKKFGPRVRLGAIFIDYPLDCGSPIKKSFCGHCSACVDACPWKIIKGVNWNMSSKRDDLLDYKLCNKKRTEYLELYGRKHDCGRCILACPWGRKTSTRESHT